MIAGNHDGTFHKSWYEQREKWRMLLRHPTKHDCDVVRVRVHAIACAWRLTCRQRARSVVPLMARAGQASLTNCTYLEDSGTVIEGIRFYGSPWQPEFFGWAFNAKRGGDIDRVPARRGEVPGRRGARANTVRRDGVGSRARTALAQDSGQRGRADYARTAARPV